jgi:hypothetical protein
MDAKNAFRDPAKRKVLMDTFMALPEVRWK